MGPFGSVLSVAVLMLLANAVNCAIQYVYFSDYPHCDETYTVGRDHVVEIAPKLPSSGASSTFTNCKLLFRAGALEDKICIKIQTLTFTNDKLELQYFDSFDPVNGITPTEKYNRGSSYSTPIEICSNEYEFTLKLHSAVADANINDIDALITVFNMQGTQRIAYFDEDCASTFKLRDSTVSVQTINAAGSKPKKDVCHLYFEYIGTNPNKTVCYQYQSLRSDVCNYTMNVLDGDQTAFTHVHTYNCATTSPQTYCTTEKTLTLELLNNGATGLPDNTFTIAVKDGIKECGSSFYGPDCSLSCTDRKCRQSSSKCDRVTGQCVGGCLAGYSGTNCITACSSGEYYGVDCSKSCSFRHCVSITDCDPQTGQCPGGCESGWTGVDCASECTEGTYGPDCERKCGECDGICDRVDGRCPAGCLDGYNGTWCDLALVAIQDTDGMDHGSYGVTSLVGAVVGTFLVVVLLGVGIHICLFRQERLQWIKHSQPV